MDVFLFDLAVMFLISVFVGLYCWIKVAKRRAHQELCRTLLAASDAAAKKVRTHKECHRRLLLDAQQVISEREETVVEAAERIVQTGQMLPGLRRVFRSDESTTGS